MISRATARWLLASLVLAGTTALASPSQVQAPAAQVLAPTAKVQPMTRGSLAKIVAARPGKAFIVAYWSVGCAHCPKELRTLGELKRRHPQLDVVLVSTDTPADAEEAAQLAAGFGLSHAEQWIFAVDAPEMLRAEIDPRWHGELPRTAFYDRQHRVKAVSGVVSAQRLQAWIEANAP